VSCVGAPEHTSSGAIRREAILLEYVSLENLARTPMPTGGRDRPTSPLSSYARPAFTLTPGAIRSITTSLRKR
jgi:hypothetical protein